MTPSIVIIVHLVIVPVGIGQPASLLGRLVTDESLADLAVPRAMVTEQLTPPDCPSIEGDASTEGISGDIIRRAANAGYGVLITRRAAPTDGTPLDAARNP